MRTKILTALFMLSSLLASAKYREVATVKYQQQYGWSKNYTVEVTFMTGYELNQATRTVNYSPYSVYGIIFWGQNQASVIKLNGFFACGSEVTSSCIENTIYDLQGYDQDGDKWNICLGNYCY